MTSAARATTLEQSANAALWASCNQVAKRIARRWSGGSAADAEDLSQEALLRVFEAIDGLRNPASLNGWVQVIVRRTVARRVRLVRRRGELMVAGSDPDYQQSTDPLPDSQVDMRRLLELVGGLPEEERRCFWLRRCEGLCVEEIARETALSRSTIQRRVRVAERRLAKRLREPVACGAL